MTLRRAEWYRRWGKEIARKRAALGDKRSGSLVCSAEDVNSFLHNTLSDPERELELKSQSALISPKPPSVDFALRAPTWTEFQEVMKGTRTASAPGPNGVLYTVYKLCTTPSSPVDDPEVDVAQGESS